MASPVRVCSLLPSATELIHVVIEEAKAMAGGADIGVELVGREFLKLPCPSPPLRPHLTTRPSLPAPRSPGSHECDWPPEVTSLPALTASTIKFTTSADVDRQVRDELATGAGLYSVDAPLLASLRPTVVVTQSLCKVCSVDYCKVEAIAAGLNPPPALVDTNPTCLAEVIRDLRRVAAALGLEAAGEAAAGKLEARVGAAVGAAARLKPPRARPLRVGFCEWTDPIFCGGHWTPELIELAGGVHPLNPCTSFKGAPASFAVAGDNFAAVDPDVIVVACCGLDIPTTRREMAPLVGQPWWPGLSAVRGGRVWVVDGNQMFNRPGPRLVDALEWLVAVLYDAPQLCPPAFPVERWEG